MMSFPNESEFVPQDWVPRDVATYASGYCDILSAFDYFGPLFDELFGEGETGVWEDVLDGLKNDPNGPQIDLRAELISQLANRITAISQYTMPITTKSERLLFAIEARDAQAVAAAMEKTLKDDKEVRRREFEGHVIWEALPDEDQPAPTIRLEIPALGPGFPGHDEPVEEDRSEPFLPNASITVAHGCLMVASHYDFLIQILTPIEARESLEKSVDWVIVDSTLKQTGADTNCIRTFSRTAEEYRATYELVRQGRMPESETMLGRIVNTILGVSESNGLREPRIDGDQLPDYEYVRRHLGPAGFFGVSEENGWFFKGFFLPNTGL
jgi:hypothetical protein